jgi:hypothetical protein
MELINATFTNTKRATFTVQLESGMVVHYTEFLNEKGKVIDRQILSRDGSNIEGFLDEGDIAKLEEVADRYYKDNDM